MGNSEKRSTARPGASVFCATGAAKRHKRPHNGYTMDDRRNPQPAAAAPPPDPAPTKVARLEQVVGECLAVNYGIRGELERLPGENLNFLVLLDGIKKYVFKIVDEHMPPVVVEMEFAAIEHAVRAGFQPRLPRVIANRYDGIETGINLGSGTGSGTGSGFGSGLGSKIGSTLDGSSAFVSCGFWLVACDSLVGFNSVTGCANASALRILSFTSGAMLFLGLLLRPTGILKPDSLKTAFMLDFEIST